MAFAGIIILSTVLAIIINKGVDGIERKSFKGFVLIFIGFGLQLAIFNDKFAFSKYANLTPYIYILSLLTLLTVLMLNLRYFGMKIALLGFLQNCITIIANGGYMPQDLSKLELIGNFEKAELLRKFGHFYNGIAITENTHLKFLSDIIVIPSPKFLASIYSIGDIFISIGLIIFIFEFLKHPAYIDSNIDEDYS